MSFFDRMKDFQPSTVSTSTQSTNNTSTTTIDSPIPPVPVPVPVTQSKLPNPPSNTNAFVSTSSWPKSPATSSSRYRIPNMFTRPRSPNTVSIGPNSSFYSNPTTYIRPSTPNLKNDVNMNTSSRLLSSTRNTTVIPHGVSVHQPQPSVSGPSLVLFPLQTESNAIVLNNSNNNNNNNNNNRMNSMNDYGDNPIYSNVKQPSSEQKSPPLQTSKKTSWFFILFTSLLLSVVSCIVLYYVQNQTLYGFPLITSFIYHSQSEDPKNTFHYPKNDSNENENKNKNTNLLLTGITIFSFSCFYLL